MMIIRREQIRMMSASRREQFANEMCAHLQTWFPDVTTRTAGDLKAEVLRAMDRAADYGFTSERYCCLYLSLAAAFGWQFDEAETNAWMQMILIDHETSDPRERLSRLLNQCLYRCNPLWQP